MADIMGEEGFDLLLRVRLPHTVQQVSVYTLHCLLTLPNPKSPEKNLFDKTF